jgi:ATP-binding cassette subfamily C protein LapB
MRAFRRALRGERALVAELVAVSLLLHALRLVPPLGFGLVFDKVLAAQASATLIVILLAMIIAALFEFAFARIASAVAGELRFALDPVLRGQLVAWAIQPSASAGPRGGMATLRRLEATRDLAIEIAELALVAPVLAIAILAAIALANPPLALVVAAGAMAQAAAILLLWSRRDDLARRASGAEDMVETALAGAQVLRAAGRPPASLAALAQHLARAAELRSHTQREGGDERRRGRQAATIAARLASAALLGVGALEIAAGRLTVGGLIAATMLGRQLQQLVERTAPLRPRYRELASALDRPMSATNAAVARRA